MNRLILGYLGVLLIWSCSPMQVMHDYDDKQDFSSYSTFGFYPEINSGLSELDEERLIEATKSVLESKGFSFSETPDLYINFKSEMFRQQSNNSIGLGVGSGGGGINVGVGGAIPIGGSSSYIALTIDLVDAKENDLKWQAITERRFNPGADPGTKSKIFETIVTKAFQKYPPENKN